MSDIINPHDKCFKKLMQCPENACAFFQQYLDPQWKTTLDFNTLELQSGSSVTSEFKNLHTDILYRIKFRQPEEQGNAAYLYTIIEHQSTADPTMALRLLHYKVNLLMQHVSEPYLPPIHTMVFYHGRQTPYPYNLDLRTCFHTSEQAEHTLQGPPQIIDLQQQPDTELLQADRAGLFSYFFKHSRDNDVLPALTALPAELLRKITQDPSGVLLIKTLIHYYRIQATTQEPVQAFRQIVDKVDPQQQEHIMKMGEALMAIGKQDGIREGRQEGKREGKQEGKQENMYHVVSNMLSEGVDSNFIRRVTGLSFDDIQKLIAKSPT